MDGDGGSNPPKITLLALIARDLATETFKLEEVFQRYEITEEYFNEYVASNPYYQKLLESYTAEWQAPTIAATNNRLKFQAAAALEEKLPTLANRMGDRSSNLADAVSVAKLLAHLAGIAAPTSNPNAGSGGPQFSIHIDFGQHKVALDATPVLVEEKQLEPPRELPTKDSLA